MSSRRGAGPPGAQGPGRAWAEGAGGAGRLPGPLWRAPTTPGLLPHQVGLAQHLQVLRNGRTADVKASRQLVGGPGPGPETDQDLSPDGIGQRGEDVDLGHGSFYRSEISDMSTKSDAS